MACVFHEVQELEELLVGALLVLSLLARALNVVDKRLRLEMALLLGNKLCSGGIARVLRQLLQLSFLVSFNQLLSFDERVRVFGVRLKYAILLRVCNRQDLGDHFDGHRVILSHVI